MSQAVFIFNPNVCTGCAACTIACQIENKLSSLPFPQALSEPKWRSIYSYNSTHYTGFPGFNLSLACNHCQEPACLKNCPSAAYSKDPRTGAVLIDPQKCIGCRYCSWACAFDAPKYNAASGTMEKCTFCNHRLLQGVEPACVKACPTNALEFAFATPNTLNYVTNLAGFPRTTLKPFIRFIPLRAQLPQKMPPSTAPESKISFQHEWPLWLLTSIIPILFAYFAGIQMNWHAQGAILDALFWGVGLIALIVSTLHLGKPIRAWRAILNFRTSWLSKEISFIGGFLLITALIFGTAHTVNPNILSFLGLQAVLGTVGICAMFSIDRVYDLVSVKSSPREVLFRPRIRLHSSSALLGGMFLAGLAANLSSSFWERPIQGIIFILGTIAGMLQLGLYANRHQDQDVPTARDAITMAARVIFGFAVPLVLIFSGGSNWGAFIFAAAGFLIDRMEFYEDLEIETPGFGDM